MIFNKNNKSKTQKAGFTLAEAMIFLLIATLVMVAAIPTVTRKHLEPTRQLHGKWACIMVGDKYYTASMGDSSEDLPALPTAGLIDSNNWKEVTSCQFPVLPESAKSIMVQLIGGGAAGGEAVAQDVTNRGTTGYMFACEQDPENREVCDPTRNIGNTFSSNNVVSTYDITFYGEKGGEATFEEGNEIWLTANFNGTNTEIAHCRVRDAKASDLIPTARFRISLDAGEYLKYTPGNVWNELQFIDKDNNNSGSPYTSSSTEPGGKGLPTGQCGVEPRYKLTFNNITYQGFKYCDDGYKGTYHFNNTNYDIVYAHKTLVPGQMGRSKTLSKCSVGNSGEQCTALLTVHGGGGSYYATPGTSLDDVCSTDSICNNLYQGENACDNRYTPYTHDPYSGNITQAVEQLDNNAVIRGFSRSFSTINDIPLSTYSLNTDSYVTKGGCGGAAGEVVSRIMPNPGEPVVINLGLGGTPNVNGGRGGDTTFSYLTAKGGEGCKKQNAFALAANQVGAYSQEVSNNDEANVINGGNFNGESGGLPALNEQSVTPVASGGSGKLQQWKNRAYTAPNSSSSYSNIFYRGDDQMGSNATGIGVGGGGSGIILEMFRDSEVLNKTFSNKRINLYTNTPGNGANGGIIVTW